MEKDNYLQIKYDLQKGLVFKWNFKDLLKLDNYYHHLLIILSNDYDQAISFVQQYFKKIKCGDFLSIVYRDEKKGITKSGWIQKTHFSEIDLSSKVTKGCKNNFDKKCIDEILQFTARLTTSIQINIISNFILSNMEYKITDIISKIQTYRLNASFKYVCSIFIEKQTKHINQVNQISFSKGIHIFQINENTFNQILNFYHVLINTAAVKYAKISIQMIDSQILSYDFKNWKTIDFNKIQKQFYGPSIKYNQDVIKIFALEYERLLQLKLIIHLQLQLFSNKVIKSTKKISLSLTNHNKYDKSINPRNNQMIVMYSNIPFKENILETITYVRITKNIIMNDNQYGANQLFCATNKQQYQQCQQTKQIDI